jgi:hypothetical protein
MRYTCKLNALTYRISCDPSPYIPSLFVGVSDLLSHSHSYNAQTIYGFVLLFSSDPSSVPCHFPNGVPIRSGSVKVVNT